jgi:tRNA(Ile)-lysidine synthase
MNVEMPTVGTYVLAVSGGVDSMTLLHLLHDQPGLELVVAHFDHGMRADSTEDLALVRATARSYSLPFVSEAGRLGPETSEATARQARYEFLRRVQSDHQAQAIITAHHQDDVLETAIINMLRGTGRRGLTALSSRSDIVRPLLKVSKNELVAHARQHNLHWREDSTNQDEAYLRNYVRHQLLTRFSLSDRERFLQIITQLQTINGELDGLLEDCLAERLNRRWFNSLPHAVAREVMASWLRQHEIRNFDSRLLERLVVAAKTAAAGKQFPIYGSHRLSLGREFALLV